MNTNSTEQKEQFVIADKTKGATKRPYVKPEVRHELVFETMALTCGKMQTTEHGCHFNRKSS